MKLTIDELKEYLKPLMHFGVMELKITEREDGKKIEVFERDEYTGEDEEGNEIKDGDLTKPFVLLTDKNGKVGFIEHPFSAFTKTNKDSVIYLINLIGVIIND